MRHQRLPLRHRYSSLRSVDSPHRHLHYTSLLAVSRRRRSRREPREEIGEVLVGFGGGEGGGDGGDGVGSGLREFAVAARAHADGFVEVVELVVEVAAFSANHFSAFSTVMLQVSVRVSNWDRGDEERKLKQSIFRNSHYRCMRKNDASEIKRARMR